MKTITFLASLFLAVTGLSQTIPPPATLAQATNGVAQGVYVNPVTLNGYNSSVILPEILANSGGGGGTNTPQSLSNANVQVYSTVSISNNSATPLVLDAGIVGGVLPKNDIVDFNYGGSTLAYVDYRGVYVNVSGISPGSATTAGTATNSPNGTPLNSMVSTLPFAVLHPNTSFYYDFVAGNWVKSNITASATITASGVTNFYTFPGSTDAGWNELQATMATINGGMYWFQTNRPSVGWRLEIDPGEFDIQQGGLMITNNEYINGAGVASTVFVFNGSTNGFTQLNLMNNPESCALFDIPTNGIVPPGYYFSSFAYHVSLNNLSIKTATNMFCVGLFNNGWNTYLNHVYVGGPAYLNAPFWTIGWVPTPTASQEMIGIYCGNQANNDQVIEHCAAYDCADGLVLAGSTIYSIDDFTASMCSHTRNGYSALNELSLGFGIGAIYTGGQVYNTKIDGYQADNCNVAAYVNYNTTEVDFNHCFLQENNYPIALLDGEPPYGYVAPVSFENGPLEVTTVFVDVTNDDSGNYVIDGKHTINPLAVSTIYLPNGFTIDPVWQLTVGNNNAITVSAALTNQVNIGAGFTLAGSGSGLTNLNGAKLTAGSVTASGLNYTPVTNGAAIPLTVAGGAVISGNGAGVTNVNPNIGFGTNYTVLIYTQSTNAFVDVSLGSKFALTLTTNTYIVFTNYASFPMKDVEVWLTQGANLTNQVAYMTNSTCMPFVFGQILTMPTNSTQSSCLTCGNLNPSGIFRFTQNITSP